MLYLKDFYFNLDNVVYFSGNLDQEILGATADSREVQKKWIFCAIKGEKVDGNLFVEKAINLGAVAIISEEKLELPANISLIQVSSAGNAAARIAMVANGMPTNNMALWGVTGTNGKTTTAFLISELWNNYKKNSIGMIGTVQYSYADVVIDADRTTPPPFLVQNILAEMHKNNVDQAILEMSSHALEQQRLGNAKFAGAIFTNLSGDHLDFHKTMENYYQSKKLLFTRDLAEKAIAIININNEFGLRLAKELKEERADLNIITFGNTNEAKIQIKNIKIGINGSQFGLYNSVTQVEKEYKTPLIGFFNVENVVGAILLAYHYGLSYNKIADVISRSIGAPGRLQPINSDKGFAAYVDYAHTDDALENVLKSLQKLKPNKIITLFGCGGDRDRTKRARMAHVATSLSDITYITSDNPRTEDPEQIIKDIEQGVVEKSNYKIIVDRRDAIKAAVEIAEKGDVILLAGKGHEKYQDINGVKHHFDDVEELLNILQ